MDVRSMKQCPACGCDIDYIENGVGMTAFRCMKCYYINVFVKLRVEYAPLFCGALHFFAKIQL